MRPKALLILISIIISSCKVNGLISNKEQADILIGTKWNGYEKLIRDAQRYDDKIILEITVANDGSKIYTKKNSNGCVVHYRVKDGIIAGYELSGRLKRCY